MKKQILIVFSFFLVSICFSQDKITWLGVDFSHVKLMGEFSQFMGAGNKSNSEIQTNYFPAWNMLFISEPDKYNIKKALRKKEVFNDLDSVMSKNAASSTAALVSYNAPPPFKKEEIQSFVNSYNFPGKDGIGVMFIAECLNKAAKQGVFHLVVLNLKTKEIILQDRFVGEPGGFGIRNYWAGAMYDVIKQIEKKHYKI